MQNTISEHSAVNAIPLQKTIKKAARFSTSTLNDAFAKPSRLNEASKLILPRYPYALFISPDHDFALFTP